ncbi:hypothetical protein BX600DRAFT_456110, partial [Xylariales sp. PMI_506]
IAISHTMGWAMLCYTISIISFHRACSLGALNVWPHCTRGITRRNHDSAELTCLLRNTHSYVTGQGAKVQARPLPASLVLVQWLTS